MKFRCPFCFFTIETDDSMRGYPVVCPGCSRKMNVPVSRLQEGTIINDFLIKSKIGNGSIGSVYLATQLSLDRQVALKILLPEYITRAGTKHFLKEARATAALSHINLVQSFAVGVDDGICFMAMTYISGGNIMDRIRREKQLPIDESLHIIQQVAEALYYAWTEQGLIHRDLKPDNIMVTNEGIVKVTDLGLAITSAEWSEGAGISGSPSYMAPELFNGAKPSPRTDVYSLGITLYQMLTGELPYKAKTVRTLAYQHQEEKAELPEKLNPAVSPDVSRLLQTMIEKNPEKRIQNMDQLLKIIWKIRQETAPDKTLIPDIHTISVRRLDYEIQRDSIHLNATVSKLEGEVKTRRKKLRLILFMIPLAILAAVITTVCIYGNTPMQNSIENDILKRITYFSRLVKDDTIPMQDIRDEGERILAEFGKPENMRQKLMLEKVRSLIDLAELRRMRIENRNLILQIRGLQNDIAKLRQGTNRTPAAKKEK